MTIVQNLDLASAVCVRPNFGAALMQFLTYASNGVAWLPNQVLHPGGFTWTSDPSIALQFATLKQARDILSSIGADENSSAVPVAVFVSAGANITSTASMTASAGRTLTFAAGSITGSSGSFLTDGFAVGQVVVGTGTTSNNGIIGTISALTPTVMTLASGGVSEGPLSSTATLTARKTMGTPFTPGATSVTTP